MGEVPYITFLFMKMQNQTRNLVLLAGYMLVVVLSRTEKYRYSSMEDVR